MNRYLNYLKRKSEEFFSKPFLLADYLKEYFLFKKLSKNESRGFDIGLKSLYPCLGDKKEKMYSDLQYIYHPAWAAGIIAKNKPEFHIDISSTMYFPAIVAAFVPVKYYEFRKADIFLKNLTSDKADLLALPFENNSVKSISCMHTVEHVGLARYGDPMDSDGDLKAIGELKRVLAIGGSLLFVVPIGKPRIYFNAHRVYSYNQILDYFSDLHLEEFTLIPKGGKIIYNASKDLSDKEDSGCGCFWFIKKK